VLGARVTIVKVIGYSKCLNIYVIYTSLRKGYTQVTLISKGVV